VFRRRLIDGTGSGACNGDPDWEHVRYKHSGDASAVYVGLAREP
jgi:hypothetical protein